MIVRNIAIIGGVIATVLLSVLFALRHDQTNSQSQQTADRMTAPQTIGQSSTSSEIMQNPDSGDARGGSER